MSDTDVDLVPVVKLTAAVRGLGVGVIVGLVVVANVIVAAPAPTNRSKLIR